MTDVYVDDSLALHTDLYQINMLQTYWKKGMTDKHAVFEAYYRSNPFGNGYTIYTGLERVIDYIQNLRFKESDIDYLRNEGNYEEGVGRYHGVQRRLCGSGAGGDAGGGAAVGGAGPVRPCHRGGGGRRGGAVRRDERPCEGDGPWRAGMRDPGPGGDGPAAGHGGVSHEKKHAVFAG